MVLITGPLMSGKKEFARNWLSCKGLEFDSNAVWDVQDRVTAETDLEALAQQLARYPVVIATEVGGGVVPMDAQERSRREAAGRLACLLAQRADTVVRLFCGLPTVLKGEL